MCVLSVRTLGTRSPPDTRGPWCWHCRPGPWGSGDRPGRQAAGARRQAAGARRQAAGGRRQAAGGRRQAEAGREKSPTPRRQSSPPAVKTSKALKMPSSTPFSGQIWTTAISTHFSNSTAYNIHP